MSRSVRILAWIVVLAACAGIGAFIASRSNPFPPGVDDPGVQPTGSTGSEAPVFARWTGSGIVRTTHELFVGGACRTNWRLRMIVREDGEGLTGRATATLIGDARCDFPTAQNQTRQLGLEVAGRARSSMWRLALAETEREPAGSIDLGALLSLLDRLRFDVDVGDDRATSTIELSVPDGDRGSYAITGGLTLNRER